MPLDTLVSIAVLAVLHLQPGGDPVRLFKRSSLMYCEMVKTGSGSLRSILPFVVSNCTLPQDWHTGPQGRERRDVGCYATASPQHAASADDRRRHFVIGSVREPCDWYVSRFAWAYGHKAASSDPQNASRLRRVANREANRPGGVDVFGAAARELFRSGLVANLGRSHEQHRNVSKVLRITALAVFTSQHGAAPNVDCWVQTGDFARTLRRCLLLFEQQGGRVDWAGERLTLFLEDRPLVSQNSTRTSKNLPGTQLTHHAPCREYFDERAALEVERADAPLYAAFGWSGCCNATIRADFAPGPGGWRPLP